MRFVASNLAYIYRDYSIAGDPDSGLDNYESEIEVRYTGHKKSPMGTLARLLRDYMFLKTS